MGQKQFMNIAPITILAAAALVAHRFVGTNYQHAAAQANTIGVTMHEAAIDEDVGVETLGPIAVETGGAVTEGGPIQSDATGRAVDHAGGAVVGRALGSATVAGDYVQVLLIRN